MHFSPGETPLVYINWLLDLIMKDDTSEVKTLDTL